MRTGGPITCAGYSFPTGPGGALFGGNLVDVEVDPETGKVSILRFTTFIDVGKAVHPSFVEGQAQGSTAQGVGWALSEEYCYTGDGAISNSTFLDYRMPTTLDLPMIDTVIVEVPNPGHPFGLRGRAGEIPIVPVIGAVANAVSNATGVRMTRGAHESSHHHRGPEGEWGESVDPTARPSPSREVSARHRAYLRSRSAKWLRKYRLAGLPRWCLVVPQYVRHYVLSSGPASRLPRPLCHQPSPDSSRHLYPVASASRLAEVSEALQPSSPIPRKCDVVRRANRQARR